MIRLLLQEGIMITLLLLQFYLILSSSIQYFRFKFTHKIDTVSGPKWSTQNVIVEGDNAYIAVNNAYEWGNYKGTLVF